MQDEERHSQPRAQHDQANVNTVGHKVQLEKSVNIHRCVLEMNSLAGLCFPRLRLFGVPRDLLDCFGVDFNFNLLTYGQSARFQHLVVIDSRVFAICDTRTIAGPQGISVEG